MLPPGLAARVAENFRDYHVLARRDDDNLARLSGQLDERRLLLLRLRTAPGLLPALVALLLFYVALVLGAAVAVGIRALLQI